ncbi:MULTISPECIES: TIGR04372 family glycosyltransferase [unclassified Bradyrhizobium]|uniref:TIGR04372 family glycosyltransferase n=1 Tax=unclassified Bradyrhizobium TaxID=2631580 RepID=UPI0028EB7893|nr:MULTISPECIES: TIGR04372 family glycosyltransferase [unclassified Bradyrhizobium]
MQRFKEPLVLQSQVRRRGFLGLFNALETLPAESARWGERSLLGPQRWARILIVGTAKLLSLLPPRLAFLILAFFEIGDLRDRRLLQRAYQVYCASLLAKDPDLRFSGLLGRCFPMLSAELLLRIGADWEAYDLVLQDQLAARSPELANMMIRALFELGEFDKAYRLASQLDLRARSESEIHLAFLKGMLEIMVGNEARAVECMSDACRGIPDYMRPHQNMASRPARNYHPNPLDFTCGSAGRLFDLCNFTGQRVTHVGSGDVGIGLFTRALAAQSELLGKAAPAVSAEASHLLRRLGIPLEQLRVLPEEWTTQIGHLGMLDILFRMRDLGWWSGRPLIVVRPNCVANRAFLRLFERFADIVVIGETISHALGEELLSLQRWYGMNFNVFRLPNGDVVPWQEAGALAILQWERDGRGHPLRDEYDRIYEAAPKLQDDYRRMRESWGMKPDDWYVCLHTRDGSHYSEVDGTGQTHRNAPIETYLDAIHAVTRRGGWVIKLGGPNSPGLPPLDRAIDYAQSGFRSELMDICLIRNAKAFIGTTSGLTNVAISFGIPSALVNCITTDPQLWNSAVRFALKPVRLADGRMLTQTQLTSPPWRWRLFDACVLSRNGAQPLNNTSDEILAVVEEVVDLACGHAANTASQQLLSLWREQLLLPHYYGGGTISAHYLAKYESAFLVPGPAPLRKSLPEAAMARQR